MEKQNGLKRTEWVVVLGCLALVLMTLGAVGDTGRKRAKEIVCQANLHQWDHIFQGIVEENDGRFLSGVNDRGYLWLAGLPQELLDWTRNRTWLCPMAPTPLMDENGVSTSMSSIFNAWGIFRIAEGTYQGKAYSSPPSGVAGSYGLNGYVIPIPESMTPLRENTYERGVPAKDGWADLRDVPDASSVPMFLDALRFDLWPLFTDAPVSNESAAWAATGHMARCCINRHNGTVNCLFVDGSVRKVGLKELWTLRWYRSFNTRGPWTKVGGVLPEDWPEWIRPFKEY